MQQIQPTNLRVIRKVGLENVFHISRVSREDVVHIRHFAAKSEPVPEEI